MPVKRSVPKPSKGSPRRGFSSQALAANSCGPKQERWDAASSRAREELLRPCPFLGFDHDRIGIHCLSRGAYGIAERSFLRAIWLNPYEPAFHLHLGHALFRQKRYDEALQTLDALQNKWPRYHLEQELRDAVLLARDAMKGKRDG